MSFILEWEGKCDYEVVIFLVLMIFKKNKKIEFYRTDI